jgi:folate-binding protein YgfZ
MRANLVLPSPSLTALPHLCALRVEGTDAANFLHNQLTQDVNTLGANEARLAGYCSAKGRLLASFVLLRPHPEEVLMITPRHGVEAVIKRLSMFVLRAKARVSLATDWQVVGQLSADALDRPAFASPWPVADVVDAGATVQLPPISGVSRRLALSRTDVGEHPEAIAAWRWLEVRSGLAWVDADTADAFVPQTLNFDALGGVNFKKGCYPGQEVVARSQYRGTLKRRAGLIHGETPMSARQELFCADDPSQPAGQVAMSAPCPYAWGTGHDAVAELKVASVASGAPWHLGAPDGPPVDLLPLPYEIPPQD